MNDPAHLPLAQRPPVFPAEPDDGAMRAGIAPPSGSNLRSIAALVASNWIMILSVVAAAVALAVIATILDTPRYTAKSSVEINQQSDRIIEAQDATAPLSPGYFDEDRYLKTQIDILESRSLAQRVAQRLKLAANPGFFTAMEADPPPAGTPAPAIRNTVLALLASGVDVELPRDSRIATISMVSASPEWSARIANAFAAEFIDANLQRKYDSSAYARNFVSRELAQAKDRLEASERQLNAYARHAGLIRTREAASGDDDSPAPSSMTTASLLQLNTAANTARAGRIEAEGRWNAVKEAPLLSSREVLASAAVQSLLSRRGELEGELAQERARHLDRHPTVTALRAQLGQVNTQLQSVAVDVRNGVLSEYVAAREAEEALQSRVRELQGATLAEQDRSVRYNTLARDADTNRTIYDGLLQRFKELNAAAGISVSNIAVIDEAEPPASPSSPNLLRNLLVGLVLGLGLAALAVVLKEHLDDRIRVPEDVEGKVHIPLLGVVPDPEGDVDAALADPKSRISEAINSLRTALQFSTPQGLPHVILFTSAQPGEGKTTTSYAVAASLARLGRRVVLVDGDMRRPAVHRHVGNANRRGLSNLLISPDDLASAVIPSGHNGLDLLPSGPIPPNPTELLASPRMQALIDQLADRYDAVIVDSPPVIGLADAPMLSALVDGVVVVVEADRGRPGALKAAMRRLRAMRPVLLGAVLNKYDSQRVRNRHSDYYSYHDYSYGTDAPAKA